MNFTKRQQQRLDWIVEKLMANPSFPYFIHYIDNDSTNKSTSNIRWVHFLDAWYALNWVCDWELYLDDEDTEFVYHMFARSLDE